VPLEKNSMRKYVLNFVSNTLIGCLTKIRWYQWEVEPLVNGRCTIKSVGAGSYLGWEMGSDSITKVVKTNLLKEWIVKSISGYIYL
jgi:hypothetical protein